MSDHRPVLAAPIAVTVDPYDLVPGTALIYRDLPVTVLAAPVPTAERFDRPGFIKVLARREDTGREGYLEFGPGALPLVVDVDRPAAEVDPIDDSVPPFGGWTFVRLDGFDPCTGGHVMHAHTDDDGTERCNRCGRALDLSPCGCGEPGHDGVSRSFC